ncbi:MAG: chromate transporter [Lachnospiraceae bacterium]|nr:chromate transporter [Lachnospiraceae bacterium]
MIYLELFWSFCKIGFTSFGGMSMVPLINSEMIAHGWMDAYQVSDILAIAEMTPGPNGLNCAIFAGLRAAGLLGCLSATLGILSPSLTLAVAAAFAFSRFKTSPVFRRFMTGVRPASLALIVATVFSLCQTSYFPDDSFSLPALLLGILDLWLLQWKHVSIIKVICLSAVLGLIFF